MKKLLVTSILGAFVLTGCAPTGEDLGADVYDSTQLNSKQETKTVTIINIAKAKVAVDNTEQKRTAQIAGTILGGLLGAATGYQHSDLAAVAGGTAGGTLGAVAGTMVKDKAIVEGVSLTYKQSGSSKVYTSTQAGRKCQFKLGTALVIVTKKNETRIQPNAECPVEKK